MIYPKKPLLVFSIVGLSVSAVAGFFIRQKILSNWEIAEFNALLKKIEDLKTEIQNDEKALEDSEKLKTNKEEENKDIKKKINKLENSIKNYDTKISELKYTHSSWKKNINFAKILKIYRKLKENTQSNLKKVESLTSYYRTISHHINNEKNMSNQIDEYELNKKIKQEEQENLNKKMENNSILLKQLEEIISELRENLNIQKSKLTFLKSQEREREREVVNYFVNKIFDWKFLKGFQQLLGVFFIRNKVIFNNLHNKLLNIYRFFIFLKQI